MIHALVDGHGKEVNMQYRIIKITSESEITVHDVSDVQQETQEFNELLNALIGDSCDCFEMVTPNRLYTELGVNRVVSRNVGEYAAMLVDEEGAIKKLKVNPIGSFLYESDIHNNFIYGTILIIGVYQDSLGGSFSGLCENTFNLLYPKLKRLAESFTSDDGYHKKENTHGEPLILDQEDFSVDEYRVLCKVFGCPIGTTRMKVNWKSVEYFVDADDAKKMHLF